MSGITTRNINPDILNIIGDFTFTYYKLLDWIPNDRIFWVIIAQNPLAIDLIYENFAKTSDIGVRTFIYFAGVWGLYGLASLMSYTYKNMAYNILDLFSKNFFGIFLAVVLLMQK